jgi:amino acid transporter
VARDEGQTVRRLGLFGATAVGVGAIVGGGILALAGTAFAATGPSAVLAFALNGVIALVTVLSFAEVSSKFPESGGTYTFAKRVLSIETAFVVGWIVWFASIVAAVLYAIGFAEFAVVAAHDLWRELAGPPPAWLTTEGTAAAVAITAIVAYAAGLMWRPGGGGIPANVAKVIVFALLVACGLWAMRDRSVADLGTAMRPFFAAGAGGLVTAMGATFIALQGFDLVAAVAGEVRTPERTVPRAMLISLGIALLIYLPLLVVVATVGVPEGSSVVDVARAEPETIVAVAAQVFVGPAGYWLVIVGALLAMLSALRANLFAASRVAMSMGRDRTLPHEVGDVSPTRGTPARATALTAAIVVMVLLVVPDVGAAGSAASLIFLVTFALAHWIAILVRQRSGHRPPPFRVPLFPLVPVVGATACVSLAVYQGVAVPRAGVIALVWLGAGCVMFLALFARRARLADAGATMEDPERVALRGRSPLVLVPIANPLTAPALVRLADAVTPPGVGRILLLSVVVAPEAWRPEEDDEPLRRTQEVLGQAIATAVDQGCPAEALTTVGTRPWDEIERIARTSRCESLLLGLSRVSAESHESPLERLVEAVDCHLLVLQDTGSAASEAERILLPLAGGSEHHWLLARLLGSLRRVAPREVTFLRVVRPGTTPARTRQIERRMRRLARDIWPGRSALHVVTAEDAAATVVEHGRACDLMILGGQRRESQRLLGDFALRVTRAAPCPILLISHRRSPSDPWSRRRRRQ